VLLLDWGQVESQLMREQTQNPAPYDVGFRNKLARAMAGTHVFTGVLDGLNHEVHQLLACGRGRVRV
jgi:hypothetical protein